MWRGAFGGHGEAPALAQANRRPSAFSSEPRLQHAQMQPGVHLSARDGARGRYQRRGVRPARQARLTSYRMKRSTTPRTESLIEPF